MIVWLSLAGAATLNVGPSATYNTIADAVADAVDGDTIAIADGTYVESLTTSKSLDFEGEGPLTVWECLTMCLISDGEVSLSGLTMSSAGAALIDASGELTLSSMTMIRDGVGVDQSLSMVHATAGLTATDVVATQVSALARMWLIEGGDAVIERSTLSSDDETSAMVVVLAGDSLRVADSTLYGQLFSVVPTELEGLVVDYFDDFNAVRVLSDLTAVDVSISGGPMLHADGTLSLEDVSVTGVPGNGFVLEPTGIASLTNVSATDCSAQRGAGFELSGNFVVDGLVAEGNVADGDGGGVAIIGGSVEMTNAVIQDNRANRGGGITVEAAGQLVMTDSLLVGNIADLTGGGLFVIGASDAQVLDSTVLENSATNFGGGLRVIDASMRVEDSLIAANDSPFGGGLSTVRSDTELHNLLFEGNTGVDGAAFAGEDSNVVFTGSVVRGNDSGVDGFFISWLRDDAFVRNVAILDNVGLIGYNAATVDFRYSWLDDELVLPQPILIQLPGDVLSAGVPGFVDYDSTADWGANNYYLTYGSQLVDAGDPGIVDPDGSRSDIGVQSGETADFSPYEDLDGDGALETVDCDDDDAARFPNAAEVCDGLDNDCDGLVDDGVAESYWKDNDGDGLGAGVPVEACEAPDGYVENAADLDDSDASVGTELPVGETGTTPGTTDTEEPGEPDTEPEPTPSEPLDKEESGGCNQGLVGAWHWVPWRSRLR